MRLPRDYHELKQRAGDCIFRKLIFKEFVLREREEGKKSWKETKQKQAMRGGKPEECLLGENESSSICQILRKQNLSRRSIKRFQL